MKKQFINNQTKQKKSNKSLFFSSRCRALEKFYTASGAEAEEKRKTHTNILVEKNGWTKINQPISFSPPHWEEEEEANKQQVKAKSEKNAYLNQLLV